MKSVAVHVGVSIENVTPASSRLLGTEGQDLSVSCKAVGGKPAPNVVVIIDEQTLANQTQSVQHTLNQWRNGYRARLECGRSYVQAKDYKIGMCCFSAKHAALRRKNND
jgi:hypothetical protein